MKPSHCLSRLLLHRFPDAIIAAWGGAGIDHRGRSLLVGVAERGSFACHYSSKSTVEHGISYRVLVTSVFAA